MIKTFNSSKVALDLDEPIVPSLFEIQIIPNASVSTLPVSILKEQIISVDGFDAFERIPEPVYQTFGPGIRRAFPGVRVDNVVELNISFNVNLGGKDGNEATTLLVLKKMKDKQYNRSTGERGLKKDCNWTMIVRQFNKNNVYWRIATMENCLFGASGITGLDGVNIEDDEPAKLSMSAVSDKNKLEFASSI
jgi:hypothetical protein